MWVKRRINRILDYREIKLKSYNTYWGVVLVKITDGSVMRSKIPRSTKPFLLLRILTRRKKN